MTKIFVTGAAGLIGSNLCRLLLNNGQYVVAIDNLSRGHRDNIDKFFNHQNFRFIHADIENNFDWAQIVTKNDTVVHLADIVGGIGYVFENEWSIFNRNLKINASLSCALNYFPPGHLIYVGTACSYPKQLQASVEGGGLSEENKFPAHPESGYGWSKLVGDIEYTLLCRSRDILYTNLDLHNVYGSPCDFNPGTAQVLPALVYKSLTSDVLQLWGSGQQGRAFVEVRDVARAIFLSVEKRYNGTIMIGPDVCTRLSDVAKLILKHRKCRAKKIAFDLTKPTGDIGRYNKSTRANEILGWKPEISISEGLDHLIEYIYAEIEGAKFY